ncbi:hypothetical protein ACXR6G_18395 [Ancylomarina sp. YFZ004]
MKAKLLLLLIYPILISGINLREKKDPFTKMFEKWIKNAELEMDMRGSEYYLYPNIEMNEYPVILKDSLFYMGAYFYYEARVDILKFPEKTYDPCDFATEFRESFFGRYCLRNENGYNIIFLSYYLSADLTPDALFTVIEYLSDYSKQTKEIAKSVKKRLDAENFLREY